MRVSSRDRVVTATAWTTRACGQPYQVLEKSPGGTVGVLFRSRRPFDAIGFEYGRHLDHEAAGGDFLASAKAPGVGLKGNRDHLVTVVLDGDDGRSALETCPQGASGAIRA